MMLAGNACKTQHFYQQEEYSFYEKNFRLPDTIALRTDGVYIQDIVHGDENSVNKAGRKIYKFYPGGQANLLLEKYDSLAASGDYLGAFNKVIEESRSKKERTLSQGYYKAEGDRFVLQQMSTPRALFYYSYFRLTKDSIIEVNNTLQGKGKLKDKYYAGSYQARYHFVPVSGVFVTPDW